MSSVSVSIKTEAKAAPPRGAASDSRAPTLTRRAYLNVLAMLLDQGLKAAVLSVVTPIMVATLGGSLYGVWQVLSRLVLYMQAADGRPTQALKWLIANQQSLDNDEEKRRHVGSALGVWLLFLPVLLAISAALVWLSPIVTRVPAESYGVVRATCALLVLNFILMNLAALPESVLYGMNMGYKRMGLQASLNVVGGALIVAALYAGAGIIGAAGAQVILAVLTGLLFWFVVKKYVPWFRVARPRAAEVRSFLNLSVWWFLWTLTNKALMTSDVIILAAAASTTAVSDYALTGFAGVTLLSFVTMALSSVAPGLGGVIGLKQYEKARRLRREMLALSWLLLASAGSTILLWNRSFVSLWVGAEYYAGGAVDLLIVLLVAQLVFIRNDAYVIDLTLRLRAKVLRGAAAALLSVVFSVALIPSLGIAGLCLGMLAGRLVLTVSYPFIVSSALRGRRRPDAGVLVRPAVTIALMFAASAYLGQRVSARGWAEWVVCAGGSFALLLGVALFAGLRPDLRGAIVERLTQLRTLRRPALGAEG